VGQVLLRTEERAKKKKKKLNQCTPFIERAAEPVVGRRQRRGGLGVAPPHPTAGPPAPRSAAARCPLPVAVPAVPRSPCRRLGRRGGRGRAARGVRQGRGPPGPHAAGGRSPPRPPPAAQHRVFAPGFGAGAAWLGKTDSGSAGGRIPLSPAALAERVTDRAKEKWEDLTEGLAYLKVLR